MGTMASRNVRNHLPVDGSSWSTMAHIPSTNGLYLNNVKLPEELVELILSYCGLHSVKPITQVCGVWKTLTTRLGFWKCMYSHHGVDWDLVPSSHKQNVENSWCLLYVGLKNNGFRKNLIVNGSGEMGDFSHWRVSAHDDGPHAAYSNRIIVESPPVGCEELDEEPNSCFATSYIRARISQYFDLAFSPQLLNLMVPFEIRFSAQFAARFDCGGKGSLIVEFNQSSSGFETTETLHEVKIEKKEGEAEWQTFMVSAVFDGTKTDFQSPKFIVAVDGKDDKFWAGHYGLKFTRVSATIKLLDPESLTSFSYPYRVIRTEVETMSD